MAAVVTRARFNFLSVLVALAAVYTVMIDLCEDMPRCTVLATSETFTEDPCPGTSKYLEAHYKCRPNDTHTITACEDEELSIKCQKGYKILINSAFYGRLPEGNDHCPVRKGGHIDCQSLDAIKAVKSACDYSRSCELEPLTIGNPCPQAIYKYLTVSYSCVPKSTLNLPDHIKEKLKRRRKNRRRKKKKEKEKLDVVTTGSSEISTEGSHEQTTEELAGRIDQTSEQSSATQILTTSEEKPREGDRPKEATTDSSKARPPAEAASRTPDITLGPLEIEEEPDASSEDPPSLRPWDEDALPATTSSSILVGEQDSTEADVGRTGPDLSTSREIQPREGNGVSGEEATTSDDELDNEWLGLGVTGGAADEERWGAASEREATTGGAQDKIPDMTSVETDTDPSVIIDERTQGGTDRSSSLLAAVTSIPIPSKDKDQGQGHQDSKGQPKDSDLDLISRRDGGSSSQDSANKHHNDASEDSAAPGRTGLEKTRKFKERTNQNEAEESPYVTERNLTVLCVNFTGSKSKSDSDVSWDSIKRPRDQRTIGFLKDWFTVIHYLDANEEKAWLYFTLGICFGIIVMLIIVLIRVCFNFRRNIRARLDVSDPTHRSALINNHSSGPDPLDAPMLEHSDSIDRIEVVRFSPRSTLRSMRGGARENRDLVNYYG